MAKIRLTVGKYSGDLDKRLQYLSSSSIFDIFPDDFMKFHTKHDNFTDFCQSFDCDITSQDDLDKLDSGAFDKQISSQSAFESWEDMAETAYQLQIKKH